MSDTRACDVLARRLRTSGDDLARVAREEAGHLEGCFDCRADLARRDPTALFALLAFEKKDEAFFAGFETRVMAGVREAAREGRGGWLGAILRPRLVALGASAAAIGVVLVIWQGRAIWLGQPAPPRIAAGPAESGAIRVPVPHLAEEAPVDRPTLLERDAAEPSPVESVASATARVISIKVAGPQQESADIVLIVDPEMPL